MSVLSPLSLKSYGGSQIITSKALGTMHAQHFLVTEREWSMTVVILKSGTFVWSRLLMNGVFTQVRHLHITVPTITCSLGLWVIHKLKRFVAIYGQVFLLLFYFVLFLFYFFCRPFTILWKKRWKKRLFFFCKIFSFSVTWTFLLKI